jgi:hypothetical protein
MWCVCVLLLICYCSKTSSSSGGSSSSSVVTDAGWACAYLQLHRLHSRITHDEAHAYELPDQTMHPDSFLQATLCVHPVLSRSCIQIQQRFSYLCVSAGDLLFLLYDMERDVEPAYKPGPLDSNRPFGSKVTVRFCIFGHPCAMLSRCVERQDKPLAAAPACQGLCPLLRRLLISSQSRGEWSGKTSSMYTYTTAVSDFSLLMLLCRLPTSLQSSGEWSGNTSSL